MKLFTYRRLWFAAIGVLLAVGAKAQTGGVEITCIAGSAYNEGEGCDKAFDHNLGTKWGMYGYGNYYAAIELSEAVYITGYAIVNANDNASYIRDIGEWEIYGTNDENIAKNNDYTSGELQDAGTYGWTKFDNVASNNIAKATNYTAYYFGSNALNVAYKYILFKRVAGYAGGQSQVSEIVFSYTKDLPIREGISYTTVQATPEGTSDYQGHCVFDNLWGTKWCADATDLDENIWSLTFTTSETLAPTGYYFVTGNDSYWRDPQAWTLYGSTDDGETWVTLDSQTDGNFPEARREYVHYTMDKPASTYNYFKLEITENKGSQEPNLMQFSEFGFTTHEIDFSTNTRIITYDGANRMSDGEDEAQLFNGDISTKWCEGFTSGKDSSSVIFGVGHPVSLYGYGMHGAYDAADRSPKSWRIEGTNTYYATGDDNASWTWDNWEKIDSVSVDDYLSGRTYMLKYYILDEPTPEYTYFRITITENCGSIDCLQLGELVPLFNRGGQLNWLEIADGTEPAVINGVVDVADLHYNRSGDTNVGTITMPFALTSDNNTQYYTLGNLDDDGLHFYDAATVEPYTPAMYTNTSGSLSIQTSAELQPQRSATITAGDVSMVGVSGETVTFGSSTDGVPYGLNSDGTYTALETGSSCATYRAYLLLPEETGALTVEYDSPTFSISDAGYATYYTDVEYTMPAGVVGTTVVGVSDTQTDDGGYALDMNWAYTEGSIVPAGTALVLQGAADTYIYDLSYTAAAAPTDNMLYGSVKETETYGPDADVDYYFYELSYGAEGSNLANVIGFFWANNTGGAFASEAHKAWLAVPQAQAASIRHFSLDGKAETDGITAVSAGGTAAVKGIYTLQGVRVGDMSKKGIYIVDGKKVIVK